jgi:hypothetical protein
MPPPPFFADAAIFACPRHADAMSAAVFFHYAARQRAAAAIAAAISPIIAACPLSPIFFHCHAY